jgi:hypothetical protein
MTEKRNTDQPGPSKKTRPHRRAFFLHALQQLDHVGNVNQAAALPSLS